jgi:hypothetical protein
MKKKPTKGTRKPFWDGRSRISTDRYRENFNSIFNKKPNEKTKSKIS